ncbi:mannan endo-1,4-beta-mannosidase [Povalibacter uvarum]|uniref:mannan endo-1,4-beta-mannosidase n=1 Tax=Povalibacter uvarum TaxID=732238 RepID=A0A841HQV0_9GAMM|nr:cellulase family glycosylhydrolase [Povalibacter uvarum]MBB6095133.1 mannan endo-1,4-beta-mannosidase [Povalibacter uvarum]
MNPRGILATLLASCLLIGACSKKPAGAPVSQASAPAVSEFVTIEGTQFRLRGKPYYFAGTNIWYGGYLGSAGPTGDRDRLVRELDQLKAAGITNIRILGMSEASELKRAVRPASMTEPGKYDEQLLAGLDFFLAEMAKRDMKAVIYVNNFWQWSGGMSQYVSWFTGKPVVDPDVTRDWNTFMDNSALFYAVPAAQDAYREVIRTLVTRRNTLTGKLYSEDPTIMSWQLANEPRPGSDANGRANAEIFIRWIDETAAFIGSLAPNQLVSTGNEGWMGTAGDKDLFVESHKSPNVDYLTYHMWAANWSWFDPKDAEATYDSAWTKAQDYLNWHIDIAKQLDKPIVLEEFGINRDGGAFAVDAGTAFRDRYYKAVFDLLHRRAAEGAPIAGSNFWAWNGAGRATNADFMWKPGDDFVGDPPQEPQGLYGIFDSDLSTIAIIREHSAQMQALGQ